MKANSTDISVTNSKFYNGLGIALGSIGQYKGAFETMERLHFENISYFNTLHAVRPRVFGIARDVTNTPERSM